MPWRLIPLEIHRGYINMAIDEAILKAVSEGRSPNTLRFYRWRPSAVSIGCFQRIHEAVDVDMCHRLGVDIVRRITGGGAVYHDHQGEITYSIIAKEGSPIPRDVMKSYNFICRGLTQGLRNLGLEADFTPRTHRCPDIVIRGRKISGNAQTRRGGAILQHGTILLHLDLERMFSLLRPPRGVGREEWLERARGKLTSIAGELGGEISLEGVCQALIQGFKELLGEEIFPGSLTRYEEGLKEDLSRKYSSENWTFKS